MDTVTTGDGKIVTYCTHVSEIKPAMDMSDFVILSGEGAGSLENGISLEEMGFVHADCSVNMLCRIVVPEDRETAEDEKNRDGSKNRFLLSKDWDPEDIFNIAKEHFDNDFRFALDDDKGRKCELIRYYIGKLKKEGAFASLLYRNKELAGFNLWKRDENGLGRIYLSAVKSGIKNVGIAVFLYEFTLKAMAEEGIKQISEWVSVRNLPSLNLHNKLFGGNYKFNGYSDKWIWKKD